MKKRNIIILIVIIIIVLGFTLAPKDRDIDTVLETLPTPQTFSNVEYGPLPEQKMVLLLNSLLMQKMLLWHSTIYTQTYQSTVVIQMT